MPAFFRVFSYKFLSQSPHGGHHVAKEWVTTIGIIPKMASIDIAISSTFVEVRAPCLACVLLSICRDTSRQLLKVY